jgi:predicted alpha/beta hydrolase family esterase
MAAVLIVPGLHNSGPDHWQTWWQRQENAAERVEQEDWHAPALESWSARVGEAIDRAEEPVWLVAHSFGCLASVHAAIQRPGRVAGALLVAPANPDRFGIGIGSPLAVKPLPFPSTLVASLNDPWMPFVKAVSWSSHWGSKLVNLGRAGHINAESGYGPWPMGRSFLRELQDRKFRPALHPVRNIPHNPHPG